MCYILTSFFFFAWQAIAMAIKLLSTIAGNRRRHLEQAAGVVTNDRACLYFQAAVTTPAAAAGWSVDLAVRPSIGRFLLPDAQS